MKNTILITLVVTLGIFLTVIAVGTFLFISSVATGLGRDDATGFSNNKYVIGRPPTSYNLYEKHSGITILDNVIGYKKEKEESYVFGEDTSYIVIDEENGSYSKKEIEKTDPKYKDLIKGMKELK
ncbi:hypothetical protein ACR3I8_17365 [Priestia flexa]